MNSRHAYIPRDVRRILEAFPAATQLAIETHLENLGMIVARSPRWALRALPRQGDFFYTDVGDSRVFFTFDPVSGVLFVQRVEETHEELALASSK